MNSDLYVDALSAPLPEDIARRREAGDLQGALRAIDVRLEMPLPDMLRARLVLERERIRRLPTQYPYDRAQALLKLREAAGDAVDGAAFDRLELAGLIDFIYIGGEKRYFVRFHRSLLKNGALCAYTGETPARENPWLDPVIEALMAQGELARRITLRTGVCVGEADFVPGEYLAHLPFPVETAQQSDVRLLSGDPDGVNPPDAPARTIWWRRSLAQPRAFEATYSYVSRVRYADVPGRPAPDAPLYPACPPPCEADLGESGAYMRFTPYLRELARALTGGEPDAARRAWRIYDFVTSQVTYAFVRDYFQIDRHGEYCAANLRGDCGLQALLFILLCRIAGIPARWQSGLYIGADGVGHHDWAQFYLPGWGWLFADPSFGGSAYRAGSDTRRRFYFGNLDPMRMASCSAYQAPLNPPKQALRADPFDNQGGEIERIGAPLPFTMRQIDSTMALVDMQPV